MRWKKWRRWLKMNKEKMKWIMRKRVKNRLRKNKKNLMWKFMNLLNSVRVEKEISNLHNRRLDNK